MARIGSLIDLDEGGSIQQRRVTRAGLDTLAGAAGLLAGQVYLITDEDKLAVATGTGAYKAFAPESEFGENSKGFYLKHASGVLECWAFNVAPAPANSARGSTWEGSGTWTFPHTFSSANVLISAVARTTVRTFQRATTTTTAATLYHYRHDGGGSSATTTQFDARALGVW